MTSEVQRRIDLLGEQLGRSVVLDDNHVRATHVSRHYGDEDQIRVRGVLHRDAGSRVIAHVLEQGIHGWTGPGRIPPLPELGLLGRLLVPVRWHGEMLGSVLVIDADESLTDAEITLVEDFARDAAGLIVAERHTADQRAMADEQDVAGWLDPEATLRRLGHDALVSRGLLPDLPHVRVLVAETTSAGTPVEARTHFALRHAFDTVRGRVRGTPLSTVRAGRGALAIVTPRSLDDAQAQVIAETVLAGVGDFLGTRQTVRIGIGDRYDDLEHAWRSRRQADLAARAVPVLDAGPVAHWDALGALQMLLRIPVAELDATFVPAPVTALIKADPQGRLAETLEEYLRRGGAGSAAAAALHIHRTTLYYRLDRVREITGLDIDDGQARLQLQLGFVAHRMLQRTTGDGAEPTMPAVGGEQL